MSLILWMDCMQFGFLFLLVRDILPHPHKFLQAIEQRSAPLRAHGEKYGPNARDELLVRLYQGDAASLGKLDEDLAAVLLIAPAFHQPAFFEAIYRAYHRCRINADFPGDQADCTGTALLRPLEQPKHHKLRRAKSVLVGMLKSCSQDFAQV